MPGTNFSSAFELATACTRLNVRSGAPRLSAPVSMQLEIGSRFPVFGTTAGDAVEGNAQWYIGSNGNYAWAGGFARISDHAPPLASAAPGVLAGRVEKAPPGVLGFDIDRPLRKADAQAFYSRGFRFCVRYLTRYSNTEDPNDLSRGEAEMILNSGLALMAVQHVARPNWIPDAGLGQTYGERAAKHAGSAGLPPGVNIWLDLEGVRGDVPRSDVIGYCNAWFDAVSGAGYATGIYVGDRIVISPDDLYWNLKTKHYWKSGSNVPDVPNRGYQLAQRIPPHANDTSNVDTDVTRNDAFGDAVQWLTRA